ncbi:hypothetical protein AKJ45_02135 [candidate division MSBL1 archaeon SCGC-AAA261F19]|uniref:Type I restriction modification DNA specificity domain-containing protein n=2 Tax=candidate division MSBL1 TaxID=215777 RepID=A0A133V9Y8_9EURY|nr:hypothetical protein AKJ43_03910 [candidate division MSBL1 archaeon SCGC-AAA261D19]KXB03244.1 hypothetical protein AKJ45_02135 [candidate division MSBL1 archaeon SCGC-AAA261F19]
MSEEKTKRRSQTPQNWKTVRLGDILSFEYGEGLTEGERRGGDFPVYGSNGIVGYHNEFYVKGPGIIVGRKGSIGALAFSRKSFWPIDTTYYISNQETKENIQFLYYLLQYVNLSQLNAATAIPGLNRYDAYALKTAIPPLSEQRKIAAVLYNVDRAIRKTEKIIEQIERVKKGVMQDLLTKGIRHEEFKKSKFGKIPKDWEIEKLGDICKIENGTTPSTDNEDYWNGNIPFVTPTDITSLKAGENEILDTEAKITEKALKETGVELLPEGTVLLTSRATIGECAINTCKVATNQGFKNLVCQGKVYNQFLLYRLQFMKDFLESLGSGSTYGEVSKRILQKVDLPLPSPSEQKKIASILSNFDEKIRKEDI